jgi:hypothetical protein
MRRAYFSPWFSAVRVLLLGTLAVVIFFWRPWSDAAALNVTQLLVAVIGAALGITIGFALTRRFRMALLRISPEHYTLAGAVGFIFGALWAAEGHSAWPLLIWFGPAAVLEGIASATSLARMQSAS